MQLMRNSYFQTIGRDPTGWIIGIDEYIKLKEAIWEQLTEQQKTQIKEISQFQGLPITIKASTGIELSMDIPGASYYRNLKIQTQKNREGLS